MAMLVLPNKRATQPQYSPQINWGSPLLFNADLVIIGSDTFYNPTNRVITRTGATQTPIWTSMGMGLQYNNAYYMEFPEEVSTGGTLPWTIAGIYRVTQSGNNSAAVAGTSQGGGSSTQDRCLLISSGTFWEGYVFDGAVKRATSTRAVTVGADEVIVVTTDGANLYCSVKGVPEVSVAVSNVGYNGYTTATFGVGRANDTILNGVAVPLLIRTRGYWNDDQRRLFKENPWSIIQAPKITYFPAGAAAAWVDTPNQVFLRPDDGDSQNGVRLRPDAPSASGATAYSLTATNGALVLTGANATLAVSRFLAANPGSLTLTAGNATLNINRKLNALPGSLVLTGFNAALNVARTLPGLPGTLTLTGGTATLDYVPKPAGTNFPLVADPGSLTLTGKTANLNVNRVLQASGGTLTLTGGVATMNVNRSLLASPAALTLSGKAASFIISRILQASPGTLTLNGQVASLDYVPFGGGGGVPVSIMTGVTRAKTHGVSLDVISILPDGAGNWFVTVTPDISETDLEGPNYKGFEY